MRGGRRSHLLPAGVRLVGLVGLVVALVAGGGAALDRHLSTRPVVESPAAAPLTTPARYASLAAPPGAPAPGGDPDRRTLVLYSDGGDGSAQLGHQYAIQAANLASRGGSWVMRPVQAYRPGDLAGFQALVYLGMDAGTLPAAFLADASDAVRDAAEAETGAVRILWLGPDLEQLFAYDRSLVWRLGWSPDGYDQVDAVAVDYGGRRLQRQAEGNDDLVRISLNDARSPEVLGRAVRADGSAVPWAIRSGNVTFVAELPFSYAAPRDRYLAGADLIQRTVAPDGPARRRALIRIEDVGPNTDPHYIREITDFLSGRGVPFSLAVYPHYRDPHGAANRGRPTGYRLVDRPELVEALKYATDRGGTIIMHGVTHQYEDLRNPYSGTSGEDYEFYRAHVDADDNVRLDRPVPQDSADWAERRISGGRGEFVRAGLPDPGIFEFPHYAGSAADYRAVQEVFGVRYDQGSYFAGLCPGGDCAKPGTAPGEPFSQFFPYVVRDVYGSIVIPENLLNISTGFNNNPPRSAEDIVAAAQAMTVVRDGVASFYFHPFLDVGELGQVVDGVQALGYEFVSPEALLRDRAPDS